MFNSDQIDVKLGSSNKNPGGYADFMICVEIVAEVNSSKAIIPIFIAEGLEELMHEGHLDDYFVNYIKKKYMNGEIDYFNPRFNKEIE